ncbi:ESX secretion-associated protein EspG, partial [Actinokineospora sp. PR83]|uniref:ESX secretion-associated protein EspG n=1 Tax=Actinokineospora sp. PR83 TaxID=2884908 RepID=UPI001F383617
DALARVLRAEGIGEPHVVLAPSAYWRPAAEERELDARARAALAAEGVVDRRGRLDVEVAASLAVLCRATTEYFGWLTSGPRSHGVLVAATGREAVLAVREGDTVVLRRARASRLAETVAEQTPDTRPAQAERAVLHRAVLAAATAPADGASLLHPPPVSPALRLARRVAALPATGGGQLHAAHRDGVGRRAVSASPVGYLDTEHGRFVNAPLPGPEERTVLAPGDRGTLAHHLHSVYTRLSTTVRR